MNHNRDRLSGKLAPARVSTSSELVLVRFGRKADAKTSSLALVDRRLSAVWATCRDDRH